MKKGKYKEIIKDIVIGLLVVSMLLLGAGTHIFDDLFESSRAFNAVIGLFSKDGAEAENASEIISIEEEAARPMTIAVTGDSGRYAEKFGSVFSSGLYEDIGVIIGEALGSAYNKTEASEGELKDALKRINIFLDYRYNIPISLIAEWFGTEVGDEFLDIEIRRMTVSEQEDNVYLYFENASDGKIYSALTAVAVGNISEKTEEYRSNSAKFSFETESDIPNSNPFQIISEAPIQLSKVTVSNPLENGDILNDIISEMGAKPNRTPMYSENDGTKVYVEDDFTLRISDSGKVTYKYLNDEENDAENKDLTPGMAVEMSRIAIESTAGKNCGDSRILFTELSQADSLKYDIYFDYFIEGGRVILEKENHAVKVSVLDGRITEMEILFRSYQKTDDAVTLIPEIMAIAASKSEVIPGYSDIGNGEASPDWFLFRGESA